MLLATRNKEIMGDYKQPMWLIIVGIVIVVIGVIGGYQSMLGIQALF